MAATPGTLCNLTVEYGIPEHVWRIPPVRKAHLGNLESWGFTTDGIPVASLPIAKDVAVANAYDARDWRKGLTAGEEAAVLYYTGSGHADTNAALTLGVEHNHIPYIATLDAAIAKAPYRWDAQTYYRGVAVPDDALATVGPGRWAARTYPVGSTVDIPGYMSTSTNRAIASAFSGNSGVIFEVRSREGAHLGELSAVGGGESEVLLPRGIRWRVVATKASQDSPHHKPTVYLVPDDEIPYETEGPAPGFDYPDEPPF